MKIKSLTSKGIYDLDLTKSGENLGVCPDCSEHRKNKKAKCFSFNVSKGAGYCSHCESRFVEYKPHGDKEYHKPIFDDTFKKLRAEWIINFAQKRLISESTLIEMKISEKEVWMPQNNKLENVIAYPFFRNNELVNVKYRGSNKSFKLESGAELCWYNYDALLSNIEIVIVEGEIDCLSFIESGIKNCISVPNGASLGKMEYFDNSIVDLEKIEKFYICVDNDEKGIMLRDELIRRLGDDKCFICNLRQYKDANEYLLGEGRESLSRVKYDAKNAKIQGLIELSDFESDLDEMFEHGQKPGLYIGVDFIDEHISWEVGRFAVWSGTPSSGKSEMLDLVNLKLSIEHGWKVAYFSPENYPLKAHVGKLIEKIIGSKFLKQNISYDSYEMAKEFIRDNIFWVAPEGDSSVDGIFEVFKKAIKTKGIRSIVIDPFNTLEYDGGYESQGKLLQKMVKFARENKVLLHLAAHPRKLTTNKDTGKYNKMTMYDIAGSSDFWNMCDYGLLLHRSQGEDLKFENEGSLQVAKVKFKYLGSQGISDWKYNFKNGRYSRIISEFDTKNWIKPDEFQDYEKLPIPMSNTTFFADKDLEIPF